LAEPARGSAPFTSHSAYDDGVLRITSIGGPASLAIAGDIDEYTYTALVNTLRKLTDGLHEIHVNLAGVTYCDLAGLRAIILLAGGGADRDGGGTRLVLHEVPGHLKTVVQILGWDTTPGLTIEEAAQQSAPVLSSP
jgi:ABC-type transporter Mla MlaB component